MHKHCFIDCGLDGGIAVFRDNTLVELVRMPTETFNGGNVLDIKEVQDLLADSELIVIEQQFNPSSKPQKGAFTNGSNYGAIVTLARQNALDVEIVNAKTWKGYFNLLNSPSRSKFLPKITKKDSVILANNFFELELRSNLDGVAEALLIAEHYRLTRGRTLRYSVNVEPKFIKRERRLRTLS